MECMRQIVIAEYGAAEQLQLATVPVPTPGPGQVLLRVAAAGVNRLDCLQRAGHYPPPEGVTAVPGLEVSGEVVARGSGVMRWQVGDLVCALLSGGGYAEYALADAALCLPLPAGMSVLTAAALPEAAFTVWNLLWQQCALLPGESVLVHGGSSGIGTLAIQMAKAFGHPVYATAGTPEKCALAERLGARLAIHYPEQDFVAAVLAATGGRGVDVILDVVGGPYLARNLACLGLDGRLGMIAYLGGAKGEIDCARLLKRRQSILASTLRARPLAYKANIAGALLQRVWPQVNAGLIQPFIDRYYPFTEVAETHRRLERGDVLGKLIIRP